MNIMKLKAHLRNVLIKGPASSPCILPVQDKESPMMKLRYVAAIGLWFAALAAMAEPAFQNGGFEQAEASGAAAGWAFGCSNQCRGAVRIDRAVKAEGEQSIRLSSATDEAPHVYCGLS